MKSLSVKLGAVFVVFWIIVILHSTVSADDIDTEFTRKGLRGLKGVYVSMKNLSPDAIEFGITKDQIQTDVELRLRLAGIKVLTKEEMIKTLGEPCFYWEIIAKKTYLERFIFTIMIYLYQDVIVKQNLLEGQGITWLNLQVISAGKKDLHYVRNCVKDMVGEFVNDYLAANPK